MINYLFMGIRLWLNVQFKVGSWFLKMNADVDMINFPFMGIRVYQSSIGLID